MSETLDRLNQQAIEAKRDALKEMLGQCTDGQVRKFKRIFLDPIDSMPEKSLDNAIQICERAVAKNKK